jgi:hypothetical protein
VEGTFLKIGRRGSRQSAPAKTRTLTGP